MAHYQLKLHKDAAKFLRSLPARMRDRVRDKLDMLMDNPHDMQRLDVKPMVGENGLWRLRVGSIRLIYEVQEHYLVIYVVTAGNRGDVYKKRG
ncbi:type II toxin-antitoxin system RelE family toxin [Thiobaca trueperi]|uniref:mRNA interferase RelE/StbE n=1 Tax=Thiobaca trueperi TaxID=127458 RepID=A0A4R3N8D8_9GAMM|nr:type II toxin-antitoxin system RelE/ParE family toxin [Thiobaca trueperi]TCT23179.1 mRNA interferase RelE/StbE [Thiobaca trueperi]